MDLKVSDDDIAFAEAFDKFCKDKIGARAAKADETGVLPKENFGDLKEIGFFQLFYPAPYGIAEGDTAWLRRSMAEESLAKHCAATFLSAGATIGLCGAPIFHFGNDAQKKKWLEPLVNLDKIGCFALTEPEAGTDAASIKTRAKPDGSLFGGRGGFILNGEKALITNAPIADVAVVMAVTDPDAGYGGVTMFLVDLSKPGITKTAPYKKMGLRASPTGGLVFEDVQLTSDDVIGELGQGFVQAMQTLELGRIGMCHFGIGIAEAAYDAARAYSQERKAFGRPIARLQAIHFKIADMKIELDGARLLARQCAWRKSRGEHLGALASAAKTYACEMAVRNADRAVQIHGGWGYTSDFIVERLLRDARLGPIGEGTSEIQRELIARELLDG